MAIDKIVAEYRLELDGLRQDVNALKGQLKSVDDSVKQSTDKTTQQMNSLGEQVNGKLSAAFTKLGGAIAAAFAVERIGSFISSAVQLAAEVDDIKKAFDALNSPVLLSQLRAAVGGTVNDLELMKVALKANNFKIPLQDLAKMLQYAKQQSDLTGRSVQELSEIIIDSIGRGATRGLFELGVKQEDINAAVKETGSLYDGMFKVITDGLETAGEGYDSFADKQERLRADIDNLKIKIGEKLLPAMNTLVTVTEKLVTGWSMLPKYIKLAFDFDGDFQRQILNNKKAKDTFEEYMERVKEFSTDEDIRFFTRSFTDDLKNQTEAIRQNMLTADASTKVVMQDQIDTIQNLIKYINNYRDSLLKTDDTTKNLGGDTKETTNQIWGLGQALLTLAKHALDASDAMGGQGEQSGSARAAFGVARTEAEKLREELVKLGTQFKDGLPSDTKEGLNSSLEDWDMYANALLSLFDSFNQAYSNSADYRLSVLQKELEAGSVTQETYDQKKRQILRDEAQREKAFSLLSISLSTARAVMSALGTVPPNPALAIIAGVTGAAQLAVAASAQIPAFEKGGLVKGGEQIIRINERGEEYVVNARATSKHKDALEAINKDRFDDYVMKIYAKQIKDKQKDTAIGWDEYFYRQYLLQNKLISATERQGDKVIEAVREMPKRHRFQ